MDGNGSDREGEKPPEGGGSGGTSEPKVKRKMKTAAQLEVLERTYQVETYPGEALRAELSAQLNLSDRQLQMWFCHRRLKDRKTTTNNNNNSTPPSSSSKRARKGEALPATPAPPLPPPSTSAAMGADELGNERGSGSGSGSSPYGRREHRRGGVPRTGVAVPRISRGRYYEPPPQPIAELRSIAYIEAQLGEPLREDGPALGIEFDPLPPGAFGAPIVPSGAQQKHPGRVYESNLYDCPEVKAIKGAGRAVHEYQFLPEKPSVRSDAYERLAQPHYYGSPPDGLITRTPVLSSGRSYMHGGEEGSSYGLQGQIPTLSIMSHQGKHAHHMPSTSEEFDGSTQKTPYTNMLVEFPFGSHPTAGLDVGLVPLERRSMHDEDVVPLERKRKGEDVRGQKEVEAHEKRMKKELEKQDMLRRKREEQMRKEMEKHDRERKKEEERLLRERQREMERCQREQRREMERREKFLLKESLKAERQKQKEEIRKEKEAARQKAANDRAAARRIAKESTELIEDERLELMELAASRKGFPSILSLDSEALQNLDSLRDLLCEFPPKTLQLKRPFAVQPWTDSEENVGNLLMLWRFCITFADVFGLWPFTLDEFVQAFHDYDPRLLGEIHIALLRTIIKDIEDVARTPAGLGANQSSALNPGGGHPHIVEGAYAWGFDIRSWQQHLSPLTWPEILRQFALSAGFGPKLKNRNIEPAHLCDDNEGTDGMSIISNLRNGAAAENAVAIMHERGYSNPRRSRHRLTPGTVKFAAFHVLSLEGSQGLNILEVADRIQKSGLRDLTTSKTPEASIAAALSRDTKLFERVAPSTYCVRTPFRKHPADAEAILIAAREKIRVFKTGVVDEVEADDVEKDDESESDTTEDPEIDDLAAELVTNEGAQPCHEVKRSGADDSVLMEGSQNGLESACDVDAADDRCNSHDEAYDEECKIDQEDNDIDESSTCEPWVQGLTEGDYSELSVEERLNALVALIGVAMEGNSVRNALEERLEAASALKKQMWAEAQLDKRRFKEEHNVRSQCPPSSVNRAELNVTTSGENHEQKGNIAGINSAVQEEQLPDVADEDKKPNPDPFLEKNAVNVNSSAAPDNITLQQSMYAASERSRAQLKSYIGHKAEQLYVCRSLPLGMDRRRNRYWQFVASASSNDPGSGRIFVELHNVGWRLIDSEEDFDTLLSSLDVRGVRESHLHAMLQRMETLFKESVKRKQLSCNIVKPKEDDAIAELSVAASHRDSSEDSPNSTICASNSNLSETSSSFQMEIGRNNIELKNILQRYKDLEEWMWKECSMSSTLRAKKYGEKRCEQLLGVCDCCHDLFFIESQHCPTCHNTFSASDLNIHFSDHMARCNGKLNSDPVWKIKGLDSLAPVRIRLLKALLVLLEVSVPTDALQPYWSDAYRRSWGMQLYRSSSANDLLQAVTTLEGAIKKDFLSLKFQTTNDLLSSSKKLKLKITPVLSLRDVPVLPWIPQTTAAVALRLMELDSAVSYTLDQKEEFRKEAEAGDLLNIRSKFTISRKMAQGNEPSSQHREHVHEGNWAEPSNGGGLVLNRSKGGRGGRAVRSRSSRGGSSRSQRRIPGGSKTSIEKLGPVVRAWKSRNTRGRGGKKRSCRTAAAKQKAAKKAGPTTLANAEDDIRAAILSGRDEEAVQMQQVELGDVNDNSEYEDEDNGKNDYGDMGEDDGYIGVYGENVEDEEDEEEDANEYIVVPKGYQQAGMGEEYEQDLEMGGYLNADSEDEGNEEDINGDQNLEQDDDSASPLSSSSEYSD